MPDPDLEIRRGPSHPDPEITGGAKGGGGVGSLQRIFLALWASVWSKTKEGARTARAPPLDPPLL